MTGLSIRTRLLAGVALGSSLMIAAQPASAQCSTVGATDTCNTVVTTNTTGNGAADRNQQYDSTGVPTFLVVPTGANITGFGLAWSPIASGANLTTVTNNGSVTLNVGNTATAGGSAAFNINASGATPVTYTGTGNVTNLGTAGNGLEFTMAGSGALNARTLTQLVAQDFADVGLIARSSITW